MKTQGNRADVLPPCALWSLVHHDGEEEEPLASVPFPPSTIAKQCTKRNVTTQASHRFLQGSKNLFCASRRIFRVEPRRHFSGRIFCHLGRNRAPRLKSLGAKRSYL